MRKVVSTDEAESELYKFFIANGVGHIHHTKEIVDQKMYIYLQILIHHMNRP